MPAQIAIGNNPDKGAGGVAYANNAKALLGHGQDGVGHGRFRYDEWQLCEAMHKVAHCAQHRTQLTAGMQQAELLRCEPAALDQSHSQGVAQGHL